MCILIPIVYYSYCVFSKVLRLGSDTISNECMLNDATVKTILYKKLKCCSKWNTKIMSYEFNIQQKFMNQYWNNEQCNLKCMITHRQVSKIGSQLSQKRLL